MKPKTVLVASGKGGVGKTCTACEISSHLTDYFCNKNQSLLTIDMDPSGDLSRRMAGTNAISAEHSIGDYLLDPKRYREDPTKLMIPAYDSWKNTLVIPSKKSLGTVPAKIADDPSWGNRIISLISKVSPFFSCVVIDSSPQLGMLHRMAILAADIIFIPLDIGSPDAILAAQTVVSVVEDLYEDYPDLPKKRIVSFISSAHKTKTVAFQTGLQKVKNELKNYFSGIIVPHRSAVATALFKKCESIPSRNAISAKDDFNKAYSDLSKIVVS